MDEPETMTGEQPELPANEMGPEKTRTGTKRKKPWKRVPFSSLFAGKWMLITASAAVALLGAVLVISGLYRQDQPKEERAPSAAPQRDEGLREESLSPFFIPLPASSSQQVVMITLSAAWPARTSVHYRSKELQIREHLYEYLLKLAEKENNLENKTSLLEKEMTNMLRELLGREEVAVRIEKVRTL